MHRPAWRQVSATLLVSGVALFGCSDDDSKVSFRGNVETVVKAMGADASGLAPSQPLRWTAGLHLPSVAHAQGSCGADVEDVLACVITRASPQASFVLNCQPVGPDCEISANVRVATNGDSVAFAMVEDLSGDGFAGENDGVAFVVTDPIAPTTGDPETDFENHAVPGCNGDVWTLTDATVNFLTNDTRGDFERTVSGCPEGSDEESEPTPTPCSGLLCL